MGAAQYCGGMGVGGDKPGWGHPQWNQCQPSRDAQRQAQSPRCLLTAITQCLPAHPTLVAAPSPSGSPESPQPRATPSPSPAQSILG